MQNVSHMSREEGIEKAILSTEDMPRRYYNILPDLPHPLPPPLDPTTNAPVTPERLAPLFPMEIIRQEVSADRYVDVPEPVLEMYIRLGRPTPLQRAKGLEKALRTTARIYFKREDVNPTGSHKLNTALAQAYYASQEGVERLATETGAGQWGTALSLACSLFDLKCQVFMVRSSLDQKPYRRKVMELYGADVTGSPSTSTDYGRALLAKDPDHPGSLGIAISEAVMTAAGDEATKYSLGSVLNHVLLHQTIIGQETMVQMEMLDIVPDHMVACFGGGSNFGGFALPMVGKRLKGKVTTNFLAVEPEAAPSLTRGEYRYDFGDTAGMTPLLKMFTLGHEYIPPPIHAGGLRYHGAAPIISMLREEGIVDAIAYPQDMTFDAGRLFARTEGIVPAPESCHAIRGVIDLAMDAKRAGRKETIVFNLSGHGLFDLAGYASQPEPSTMSMSPVVAEHVADAVGQ